MNKKLIALAVGAAMAAPMAASAAPTFYGQLQAEIANIDNEGYGDGAKSSYPPGSRGERDQGKVGPDQSAIIVDDNKRGRLGVKGSEDLGGDLKAIYKFEWQVETTQAQVNDGTREAFVGLKGNWGEFQVGALKSAYKYTGGVKYDPLVATVLEARSNGGMQGRDFSLSGGAVTGQHSFIQNSLSYRYKAKNWALWLNYAPDEAGGSRGREGDIVGSFKYFQKNWEVFAAYAKDNDAVTGGPDDGPTPNPDTGVDQTNIKVGGQIKLGKAHRFSLQYETSTIGSDVAPDIDDNTWFLGYVFSMGKNQFIAQAGMSDFEADADLGDTTYYALAWKYKFTKKTSAWLGYRSSSFDDPTPTVQDADLTAISAGMRIDF